MARGGSSPLRRIRSPAPSGALSYTRARRRGRPPAHRAAADYRRSMGDPISADSTSARALAQRALGLLFLAGSLVGAISLVLPHGSRAHDGILWGNTALAVITGAALLLLPALPSWLLQATLAGGTLVITRARSTTAVATASTSSGTSGSPHTGSRSSPAGSPRRRSRSSRSRTP